MNESTDLALKNIGPQLADIEPPAEAEIWPWYIALLIIASLFIAAARLAQMKRHRHQNKPPLTPAEMALERLAELEQQNNDSRTTAFRLATILRLGMELQQLTEQPPTDLAPELHEQWQRVIQQLSHLRYQSTPTNNPDSLPYQQIEALLLSRVSSC